MNLTQKGASRGAPERKDRRFVRSSVRTQGLARLLPLLGALCLADVPARAQMIDCTRLQAQIAALDQASAPRSNPYAAAAQKQRAELDRTAAYGRSLGCDRQQFAFFGGAQAPQCPALNARIQQMQANLGQLQSAAGRIGNSAQRQDLVMRYNAYCRGTIEAARPQQRGFFENLFGGSQPATAYPRDPMEVPFDEAQPGPEEDQTPHGGSQAVCVKSCDGSFFPLNYSARRGNLDTLADLCKALCPNTETELYTRAPAGEIQTAVSTDGSPYMDLPNALKYQKSFNPSCTCRPPGETWAQALGEAERLLGRSKGDIIVTPEKSAEMSRPRLDAAERVKLRGVSADPKATAKDLSNKDSANKDSANKDSAKDDDPESREAIAGEAVPTASKDSAGIATGEVKNGPTYGPNQGVNEDMVGPDGVKRHVRRVGPLL